MAIEDKITCTSQGSLGMRLAQELTIDDLESFCAKARSLGLSGNTKIQTSRQGVFGPITGFFVSFPIVPKPSS